jgi:probable phosphoglycerate mutase
MTRLLCVRHAESLWNAEGRWQGQADPPLSDRGRNDAAAAAARLNGTIERIVSSDLARALETAEIVAGVVGAGDVEIEPDLREVDIGRWSGLTRDEIEAGWPGGIDGWRAGRFVPPGAEDPAEFLERVVRGLRRVGARDDRPALVVTHGGGIGRLEHHLGVHPGVPLPRLSGRWFDVDSVLPVSDSSIRAVGDRVDLLAL